MSLNLIQLDLCWLVLYISILIGSLQEKYEDIYFATFFTILISLYPSVGLHLFAIYILIFERCMLEKSDNEQIDCNMFTWQWVLIIKEIYITLYF